MKYCRFIGPAILAWIGAGAALAPGELLSAPRVELELAMEPGSPVGASQRWLSVLKEHPFAAIRIRSARGSDEPAIETEGSGQDATYRVLGLVSLDNRLHLPGRSFTIGDSRGLGAWLEKLRDGGPEELSSERQAFGLSSRQLVAVHEALARPVSGTTVGERPSRVVNRLLRSLPYSVAMAPAATARLDAGEPLSEEWEASSTGTALAGILRPLGLCFAPERLAGTEIRLRIVETRELPNYWPVGWPSTEPPGSVLPELFKFLNVEIDQVPLQEALDALQPRLRAPLRIDHAALARQSIDPKAIQVSLPAGNTYYKVILERLLGQARLKYELRVDEGEKPFLWITTLTGR